MIRLAVFLLVLLAGCGTTPDRPASTPAPAPTPGPAPAPAPTVESKPPTENIAVAGLMQSARADAAAGRLSNAAASIERALRIEPRNPRLWNELARVRFQQRDYAQAESVALRSNSFAGTDNALREANWRLVAQAREARGNSAGARDALDAARRAAR